MAHGRMSEVSGPRSAIDRRRLLTGAGMLALLVVAAPACAPVPPPAVDDLEAQRHLALRDSELAAAAAAALTAGSTAPSATDPPATDSHGNDSDATAAKRIAAALTQVSTERAEHARALAAEIARAAGRSAPETTTAQTSPTPSVPGAPAPTVSQVINALRIAADSAGKLAVSSTGYRAGLLATIAAACTASYAVSLVGQS